MSNYAAAIKLINEAILKLNQVLEEKGPSHKNEKALVEYLRDWCSPAESEIKKIEENTEKRSGTGSCDPNHQKPSNEYEEAVSTYKAKRGEFISNLKTLEYDDELGAFVELGAFDVVTYTTFQRSSGDVHSLN